MVHLAELLVVMTDRLKIVRNYARNGPRARTQALIDDAFLASLSAGKQRCRVLDELRRRPVETQQNRLQTTCECLAVASKQESCCNSMSSSL